MSLLRTSLTVGAVGILAYCIYFDRKRRNDPEFKAKLKKKRADAKKSKQNNTAWDIPIFKDPGEMQAYFLKQVQLSDDLMLNGKLEEASFHLANAAVVCSQKNEFLGVMQKTLPAPVFQLLLHNYQIANERYVKKILQTGALKNSKSPIVKEFDDTEIE